MSLLILKKRISEQKSSGLFRALQSSKNIYFSTIDLSSNDYLGFAQDKQLHKHFLQRIKNHPVGSGGSRLLGGNLDIYAETEEQCATFVNRETALLFPSGYQANIALCSALLKPEDMVFSDEYNHASIIDGLRLTRAEKIIFPHRDYQYLAKQLRAKAQRKCLKLIISESLFSMEGSVANISALAALAAENGALLVIDEAHSTGLWGSSLVSTLGLTEYVFATIHTAGKALGASGAWIAGNHLLKKYLTNFARPFIFSTAPLPAMALLLQEAIKHFNNVGMLRAQTVHKRADFLRQSLAAYVKPQENTPILSVILGECKLATKICNYLQKYQWGVYPIRYPSVPINAARLRVTVKWSNNKNQLANFAEDLKTILTQVMR